MFTYVQRQDTRMFKFLKTFCISSGLIAYSTSACSKLEVIDPEGPSVPPVVSPDSGGPGYVTPTPPADPCATLKVSKSQELLITNLSVVNDTRASWKFDTLISNMIPLSAAASSVTDIQKDAFLRSWLGKWNVNQTVNTFSSPARTQI